MLLCLGVTRPQVSLRVTDVPEVSWAEMHMAAGAAGGGKDFTVLQLAAF